MTPHSSEDETDDVGAAVEQFRRALYQRVDAHLSAHPRAGVPRVARAATPRFSMRPWALAMGVALVIVAVGGAIVWPRGARVYAAGADGLQVTLADDSRVEMRAHSEMTVGRASDGIQIDLKTGDIIVTAADQRDGHLYVRTKDMTVAVDGTVFLVNAGQDGSRVGVIEGEVRVREGDVETRLRSGEQVATSPTIARRPLTDDIKWSRNATAHLAVLDSKRIPQTTAAPAPIAAPGQAEAATAQVARTEFEEASIRVCDPNNIPPGGRGGRGGAASMFRMTPGRIYGTCLTLATLVRTAYGGGLLDGPAMPRQGRPTITTADGRVIDLPDPRDFSGIGAMSLDSPIPAIAGSYALGVEDGVKVRGGPDWVRSELYTIEAVAGGPADAQTMRGPMLRALLERRFGVKVHVETEQIPALKLIVAPGGLKMKEGICTKSETPSVAGGRAAQSAAAVRRNLDAVRRGMPVTGRCGGAGALNGPNMLVVGAGLPIEALAGVLAQPFEVPVIDQTGIPGTALFNFVLEFVLDDSLPREGRDQLAAAGNELQLASDPSTVPRAPGLVTALEEQLGLRLERIRAPREFIVIDAVERPAPN
jgi:uncharacterized protein (TIGR03435 family)